MGTRKADRDRGPTWVLVAVAAAGEVAGTASLRLSEGLTRPLFVVGVVVLYCASIAVFGRVLGRGLELGVAYGVLTSSGLAGATLLRSWFSATRLPLCR